MPTTLQITSCLQITPLFDILHPPFEKMYRDGVCWSLLQERYSSPLTDRYFLTAIRETLTSTDVDGQQGFWLPTIGFQFGRLHGAILSPSTGKPRAGVTALVRFQHTEAARGYDIGREWYFIEVQPAERAHIYTDGSLLDLLQQVECESILFQDEEATWYFALGCILGELSATCSPLPLRKTLDGKLTAACGRHRQVKESVQEREGKPFALPLLPARIGNPERKSRPCFSARRLKSRSADKMPRHWNSCRPNAGACTIGG